MHASACRFTEDETKINCGSLFRFLFQQISSSLGPGNNNNRTPYFLEIFAPPLGPCSKHSTEVVFTCETGPGWESNFLLLHLPELFAVCESQYSIKVPQNLAIVFGINSDT